jgi:hypothetical protein
VKNFDWLESLVQKPGINIQRLTTSWQEVVTINNRKKVIVLRRRAKEVEFSRVPPRKANGVLARIRSANPKIEGTTI